MIGSNRLILTRDPKFRLLRDLHLPACNYVIFGSAPMYAHGLRHKIADLDIIARRCAWQTITSLGELKTAPSGNGYMVELYGGQLQFFDQWITPDWDVDKIIQEAVYIDGLPFARLSEVLRSKSQANRSKDQDDLRVLRAYFASH
ncbi:MAG: hypothetical protein LC775_00450 [Acidobacteria bacterium]|nr:hypothetical protein [Acidobacteriota bacterium]